MSLSSINDMDSHNLIIALYSDALENDNTIAEPQFTINGNDYSTLTWSGTTMLKPTEAQLVAKYNTIKNGIREKLVREQRDKLLIDSDKYAVKDFPFRTKSKKDQWMSYRTNLRNLTDNLDNFTLDLNNFEITNFDTHKPTEPGDETGLETKTFDEDDTIVDGKFIITGHNTLNNFLVGDGTSYVPKTPSQIKSILDLEIGTDVQAYDSVLNAIANITPSNNKIAVFSGPTTAKLIDFRDEDNMISNSSTSIPSQQSVKAYVDTKVSNLVDSAPGTLDTLNELAAALGDNANFSSTVSTSLGEKLVKSSNLSDLTNASTARTNLGLEIGSDIQAYNVNLVPVTANPGSGTTLSSIGINGTNYSISAGGSGIGITGTYASEWKIDAPKDNGTICVGSLYITNSGSGQTQATGSWTGTRNLFIGSGAGGYQTSSNDNNTFIGGATALNWQKGDANTFLGSRAGEDIQGTTNSSNNTFLGFASGDLIQQGNNNICLGAYTGPHQAYTDHNYRLYINMAGTAKGSNGFIYGDQSAKPTLLINADVTIKNGSSAISSSNNPSGNLTVYGDITLHDGGSLKEASGVAALTFDASGNITKIGQDTHTSGQFLKWDGSKAVWDTVSGGGSGVVTGITNFSNNKLVTASGSSTLNGEGALTFDSSSGLFSLNHSTPEFKIRSSANEGIPKITMIGDYDADRGDIWQITTHNGVMSFSTDHITVNTVDQTMLTLTGNLTNVTNSLVDVKGKLTVASLASFNGNIRLLSDTYLYLNNNQTSYLKSSTTSLTIESNDILTMNSDTSTTVNTPLFTVNHTSHANFVIKTSYSSNGQANLTMISDNNNDRGDGFRINTLNGTTSFSTDHGTIGTYDKPILSLLGHTTQSSRKASIYGQLVLKENISMVSDKKIYWNDQYTYISGTATSMTIESDNILQINADTSATITSPLTSITGNLDVASGLDVTGTITCSGSLNIEGDIDMATSRKLTWVDDTQYISGTETGLTIESDDTLQINADTSVTITTPLTSISGNLDVGSGIDVTGGITCSGSLDIAEDIDLAMGKKLTWVDDTQYISGTSTGLTIESDDTLQVNADTSVSIYSPLLSYRSLAPNFQIKSTNATNGVALFTMIGDNNENPGDGWQIKTDTGVMTISSNHNNINTYDKTILTLTGNTNLTSTTVAVAGKLTVASDLDIEGDIDLATGKKLTWVNDTQYISGTATGITIESDDTLLINSDTSTTVNTPLFTVNHTSHANFVIKSTDVSSGQANLTMISDNNNDRGDGFRINTLNGTTSFSTDHGTIGTYDKPILSLLGHTTQSSRKASIYGQLVLTENISMVSDKKIYWNDQYTYISGTATSMTIESDNILQINADTSATITSPLTSITGNLDVASGLDVTGNITCSGSLDITGDIDMATARKLTWVDDTQYISGTETGLTIESDDTLQINADTSVTITTPLTSISGNLDVGSGIDVTGGITCSGSLDIAEDIDMNINRKIAWVDDTQYISGTSTGLTIESDDTLQVNADTSVSIYSPLLSYRSLAPNFQIKSTNATNGIALFTMIGDNNENPGDGWQIKTDTGVMTISSNHNNINTYDKTILTLTGNTNLTSTTVAVAGKLTVASDLDIEGDIDLATGKKLTWVNDTQYISGTATGITIESDDTLLINSDTSTTVNTPLFTVNHTSHANFVIKSTDVSSGQANLTMISDNNNDRGDGMRINTLNGTTSFSTDHGTIGTYDKPILSLLGHTTQSSRKASIYGQLVLTENISMVSDKKIYWNDQYTYISGTATSMTIESDNILQINADTSATITSPLTSITGNLDVASGLDVTGTITCSGSLNIEGDIDMATARKLTWVDDTQYISGTETGLTIESDDTLQINADTSVTITTPLTSISGNLDVGSGIDVTGGITCSGSLDIAEDIDMNINRKIAWVDDTQYISGTSTGITIESDNTLQVNADTSVSIYSPLLSYRSLAPNFQIKSTDSSNGIALFTMIGDNNDNPGDGWQIKTDTGVMTISSNHNNINTYDKTILTLTGNTNLTSTTVAVAGKLTVASDLDIEGDIDLATGKKLTWVNDTQYISGTATGITIESDDTLLMNSDTSTTVNTPLFTVNHTSHANFVIKSTNVSNGQANLTMISDNNNDRGDGMRINTLNGTTSFSTDHGTIGTYDKPILSLLGHTTQSSRKASIYGKLEVYNGISVDFGSDATADMFYRNSSGDFTRLAKGTAGQVLMMNAVATAPEWDDISSGGVTISNNVNNRVLTGDGTNANAEANMTFSGSALNVVGTISCDTSLTIDSSVLDSSDILHISDISEGTATASKALVLNASKGVSGITSLGTASLDCQSISSNSNLELDPNGSGVVVFKGNSTRESGQFKLNCENNTHGITIKGPPHSADAMYTLTLPDTHGNANEVLKTDGSGNLSWTVQTSGGGASALNDLSDVSISGETAGQVLKYNGTNWVNDTDNTGGGGGGGGGLPTGVTYTGSGNTAIFDVTGNIRASQDITAYYSSDRRFKDNLKRISEPNEKIKKINGYEFDWNDKHELYKNIHDVGVVAQEIEEVLPEVVLEREDGYKAVKYEKIIALLIESNKDLLRRVEELEEKVKKA